MANENTSNVFYTGRKSGIGPSGVPLAASTDLYHNLIVYAPAANAAAVYVGASGSFTMNSADATDGYPVYPGTSLSVPIDDPSKVYVASPSGNQNLWFLGE